MIIAAILVLVSFAYPGWRIDTIGPCPTIYSYDVVVGNGRNDDTNRLYVSTRNGGIYEWTRRGNNWEMTTVKGSGIVNLATLELGNGRNDGINRLYYAEFRDTGGLYEASWTGASWAISRVDSGVASIGLVIGKARPDSISRIYLNSARHGNWEYTRYGSAWNKIRLSSDGGEGSPVVGNIRNDGINRVACYGRRLSEMTWSGITYDSLIVDTTTLWTDPLLLGNLRNDGLNRLLANSNKGRIEFVYSNGSWSRSTIDTTVQRGDILVAALKADGKKRVYTNYTAQGSLKPAGPVNEFTWNNSSYDRSRVVDAISGATASLVAGVGRNDGIVRMYAPHYISGKIYEITNDTPYVEQLASLEKKSLVKKTGLSLSNICHLGTKMSFLYSSNIACVYFVTDVSGKVLVGGTLPTANNSERTISVKTKSAGLVFLGLRNANGEAVFRKIVVLK